MGGKRLYLLSILILLAGMGAGFFDFPGYANQGVDRLNAKASAMPFLSRLGQIPRIPNVPFRLGLDLQGGIHLVYEADLSKIDPAEQDAVMEGLRDVIERRVNFFGVTEPVVQVQEGGGAKRLIVELAGIQDPARAIQIIGETPRLDFREPKANYGEIIENNQKFFETGEGTYEDPFQETTLTGRFLKRAGIDFDTTTQTPLITLEFNEEGAKIFEELTARNVSKPLAIYLDGVLLQAPIVQSAISGGRAQITRDNPPFAIKEVKQIVRELNAGALPVDITMISQTSVGPTLGKISLQQSLRAGVAGLALVAVFMILFYRLPGLVASLALFLYVLFTLAILKGMLVTFTLAGIAGLILSVGMAVDANILIFSRMREELGTGKKFIAALEEGFHRAWPSIRDGNLTTLVVALIMFWFGSSFVQGFALPLAVGIVMSMFSALFITKIFLKLFTNTRFSAIPWLWQ